MNTYDHVLFLKKLFNHLGISEDRIQQYFVSAAEVEKFIKSVEDITNKVNNLPPLPKFNPK
jgi:coenzyme F420-reducing hydrogenase delta subunit